MPNRGFRPGISIIGGLLLVQLLTLNTTPVIYLALDRISRLIEKAAPPATLPPAQAAGTQLPQFNCRRSGCVVCVE